MVQSAPRPLTGARPAARAAGGRRSLYDLEPADLARLAADVVGDLRRSGEPLLAEVFDVIDSRHAEPLSLRDVAQTVGMTPGHLTTIVRRRTGRTVQEWILQRRKAEARRLLSETDLPIAEIARRVGHSDPGYFSRQFRKTFGMPPRGWRASPAE